MALRLNNLCWSWNTWSRVERAAWIPSSFAISLNGICQCSPSFCDRLYSAIDSSLPSGIFWGLPPPCRSSKHAKTSWKSSELAARNYFQLLARSYFRHCILYTLAHFTNSLAVLSFTPTLSSISRYVRLPCQWRAKTTARMSSGTLGAEPRPDGLHCIPLSVPALLKSSSALIVCAV